MNPTFIIKSGTTSIPGATVKGNFSYFSGSTRDLGPSNTTGFYAGIDPPSGSYTVYQVGGANGWTARVANSNAELNSILNGAGATGTTLNNKVTWATNTNSISINSGTTTSYYLGGTFQSVNNVPTNCFVYLNSDGSQDTSFDIGTGFGSAVSSITLQSDGKILCGGLFTSYQGSTQNRLIRLKLDGLKDTSFDIGTGFNGTVRSIKTQSDGKILIGGGYTTFQDLEQYFLVRLNSNGSKDTSFDIGTGFNGVVGEVFSIEVQSDGKILVGGNFTTFTGTTQNRLLRLNSDGSKDTSFDIGTGFNSTVYKVAIQSDGKILVGGAFSTYQDSTQNRLIRLNSDGSKDTSFDIGTGFSGTSSVWSLAIQSDGKIMAGGSFTTFTGATQNKIIRLNSNGSKDTSFDSSFSLTTTTFAFFDIKIQSNGKILCGGGYTGRGSIYNSNNLVRFNSDGSTDTLNIETGFNENVESIAINSEGKIFVGGYFTLFSGSSQNRIIKTLNYSLDPTFNIGTGFNSAVNSIKLQSDGKILVGGDFGTFTGATQNHLIRLNSNGSKDTSFDIGTGFNGSVETIAIQSDGKILVGGGFSTYQGSTQTVLARLNSDGSIDTSFQTGVGFAGGLVFSIALQSDGKILAGGSFTSFSGSSRNKIIRLNSDGSRDTSLPSGLGSTSTSNVLSIAIQSDGKILVGGAFTFYSSLSQNRLIRLNSSDGTKDTSLDIGTGFNTSVLSIAIQSDGKILIGGGFSTYQGSTQNRLIRLNSDGSKDTSFDIGTGFNSIVYSIAIQSDGKILCGGLFTTYQGLSAYNTILLNSNGGISNNTLILESQVSSVVIQ